MYIEYLKAVQEDMHARYKDLLDLEIFPWLVETFAINISVNECDSAM